MSVNSLCPSLKRCPKVFSNPCLARDPYVSISGINLSFIEVTLGIYSLGRRNGGGGWVGRVFAFVVTVLFARGMYGRLESKFLARQKGQV